MGIIKKITPIPRTFSGDFHSMESSLAKNGYQRFPGTYRLALPLKEMNQYRTGLDVNAAYLRNLPKEEREAEIDRIKSDKARLEAATGLDLSPTSSYYNYASSLPDSQKVSPVKLGTQDKFFNLADPYQEITWNWIKVYPAIAPSMEAITTGQVHPDTVQFVIADDEVESRLTYTKKQKLNKAIQVLDSLTPTKRKIVARLMGLPVTDATKEEVVYNLIDNALKEGDFLTGEHKGNSAVTLFTELVTMKEDRIRVKDLVDQGIASSIYRIRANGRLYEGENEVAASKNELVDHLLKPKNQEELFALEKKLTINKIQEAQ